ncbi:MAG TPA: hypothetical protein VM577_14195 [Anaerovoracaceae bacterium]|nr:hypothetical protein [Anaerovoracaceae bacterium]
MFTKLANTIEMSFEIPQSEKDIAASASEKFDGVVNALGVAKDHLDIMYNPFKKHENISTEAVAARRGVISRFKRQVKENYNKVKASGLKAMQLLNYFATDTHTLELINSFKDSIQDVEKQVTIFMDILDDYKSPDFRANVVSAIEGVKKQSAQVEQLIKERIIDHIDANILAKNWVSNIGDALHMKIQDRVPLVTELFNERQKALENAIPDIQKRPQTMNPGNTQRVYYPTDARESDLTGEY